VTRKELVDVSANTQADLDRFQRQKIRDLRDMLIAYAKVHVKYCEKVSAFVNVYESPCACANLGLFGFTEPCIMGGSKGSSGPNTRMILFLTSSIPAKQIFLIILVICNKSCLILAQFEFSHFKLCHTFLTVLITSVIVSLTPRHVFRYISLVTT
jgi:hypothetical protein